MNFSTGVNCIADSPLPKNLFTLHNNGGMKETAIDGKPKTMFQLLEPLFIEGVADVLTMGAKKYARDNWKKVDRDEYERAIYSHLNKYLQGNKKDMESGFSHLFYVACNAMFLDYFDRLTEGSEVES